MRRPYPIELKFPFRKLPIHGEIPNATKYHAWIKLSVPAAADLN
jgi:hypothetical protein